MSVKIRFRRMGRKNHPFYRLNAIDSRSPRDGRVIEELGYYDPAGHWLVEPGKFQVWITKDSASGKPVDFELAGGEGK